MFPALSPTAAPVSRVTFPVEPELDVPEVNCSTPLTPLVPALTLEKTTAPVLFTELFPEFM